MKYQYAKEKIFLFLKNRGHKPFDVKSLIPYFSREIGIVEKHHTQEELNWYVEQGWVERLPLHTPLHKRCLVYRVRLDRDMSRLKYRNQCRKKYLVR